MLDRYLFYAASSPDYYDVPWRQAVNANDVLPGPATPSDWKRHETGPWVLFAPPEPALPRQGWKVHVSATPQAAAETIHLAAHECIRRGVTFKYLASRRLVHVMQLKYADRRSSGKVMTCYPRNDSELQVLTEALQSALSGRPGARIIGEVSVEAAPVFLRHGAFVATWIEDDLGRRVPGVSRDGALVPDRRGIAASAPDEVSAFVEVLMRAAREREAASVLDIEDARLLHRSNAGGVFRAVRPDGRTVVLKEARHHTGYDPAGLDAVTRLHQEYAILRRLDGLGLAPSPSALIRLGDSDLIEMEYLEGLTLAKAITTRHPEVNSSLSAGSSGEQYLADMSEILNEVAAILDQAHRHGVWHGDVQPANIVLTDQGVRLIDWESGSLDGARPGPAVGTPGYYDPNLSGPAADLFGLHRCRLTALNPLTPLLDQRPDLEGELVSSGLLDLGLPVERGERFQVAVPAAATAGQPCPSRTMLVDGIEASATLDRDDRLFPGDVEQFATPGGGIGLLHGAAGVIEVLALEGRVVDGYLDWLDRAERRVELPGTLDGALGIALCLARCQWIDRARTIALRECRSIRSSPSVSPWWRHGRAGQMVALFQLGALLREEELVACAVALARSLVEQAEASSHGRAGLIAGWAGVASALLRSHDLVGEDHPWLLEAALAALARELPALTRHGAALLSTDTGKAMPYLGEGSAACGWAAQALLERLDPDHPSREQLNSLVDGVREACAHRIVAAGGLLEGRSGLLAALDRLTGGTHPLISEHQRRLGWYCITSSSEKPRSWRTGTLSLGRYNLRVSADLATGAAGLVLALGCRPALDVARVLGLPTSPSDA